MNARIEPLNCGEQTDPSPRPSPLRKGRGRSPRGVVRGQVHGKGCNLLLGIVWLGGALRTGTVRAPGVQPIARKRLVRRGGMGGMGSMRAMGGMEREV